MAAADEHTLSEFDRGKEAGRVAQKLVDHDLHLAQVDTSLDDVAVTLKGLVAEVRTLREEARLRELGVSVTAETLATDQEKRRVRLADQVASSDHTFSRRERMMALGMGGAMLALGILAAARF